MKVWSKGLGKIELILDFEKYHVEKETLPDGERIYIKGMITDPVIWDFRITMTDNDIPGLLNIALDRKIIFMILKNLKVVIPYTFRRLFQKGANNLDTTATGGAIGTGDSGDHGNYEERL